MAVKFQFKTGEGIPSSLMTGEPAFDKKNNILYIGDVDGNSVKISDNFIITVMVDQNDNYSFDKTFEEVKNAMNNGLSIIIIDVYGNYTFVDQYMFSEEMCALYIYSAEEMTSFAVSSDNQVFKGSLPGLSPINVRIPMSTSINVYNVSEMFEAEGSCRLILIEKDSPNDFDGRSLFPCIYQAREFDHDADMYVLILKTLEYNNIVTYKIASDGTWSYTTESISGGGNNALERLQYYGDANIEPSPEDWFILTDEGAISLTYEKKEDASLTNIVIPYKIGQTWVSKINADGFNSSSATDIIIPNSVVHIGEYAFWGCSNLESISIPDRVSIIKDYAFGYCSGLTSITIPDSVTRIGYATFEMCSNLESISIPNSVISIEAYAFNYCSGLTSITIPDSVTIIGEGAFFECSEDLTIICTQGSYADTYAKENGIKVMYDTVEAEVFTILCTIDTYNNTVEVDKTYDQIRKAYDDGRVIAFDFGGMAHVVPIVYDYIDALCFSWTYNHEINNIVIREQSNTWESYPDALVYDGLDDDHNPEGLTIKMSLSSYQGYVLDQKKADKQRIESLYYYGDSDIVPTDTSYFEFKTSDEDDTLDDGTAVITKFTDVDEENPLEQVVVPYKYTVDGIEYEVVGFEGTSEYEGVFANNTNLVTVIMPNCFKSTGDGTFYDCKLLETVKLFKNLETIGNYAFVGCDNLFYITIPDSVTTIGDGAFNGCINLSDIIIPENVTDVGAWCFSGCESLTDITILGNILALSRDTFSGTGIENVRILGSVERLTLGTFYDCKLLEHIELTEGTTVISDAVFNGCENLLSIFIPDSVTEITNSGLESITGLKVYCNSGSYAELWAKQNDKIYEFLDEPIIDEVDETTYTNDDGTETITYSVVLDCGKKIYLGELPNLVISLPSIITATGELVISDVYECELVFTSRRVDETSGEVFGTSLSYSGTPIIWVGDDCDSDGNFTPEANTSYEISIKRLGNRTITSDDGTETEIPNIVARVGAY